MRWCITKIENHPDRFVEEIFGPYDDENAAEMDADELNKAPENFNGDHQLFSHRVRDMESTARTMPQPD